MSASIVVVDIAENRIFCLVSSLWVTLGVREHIGLYDFRKVVSYGPYLEILKIKIIIKMTYT